MLRKAQVPEEVAPGTELVFKKDVFGGEIGLEPLDQIYIPAGARVSVIDKSETNVIVDVTSFVGGYQAFLYSEDLFESVAEEAMEEALAPAEPEVEPTERPEEAEFEVTPETAPPGTRVRVIDDPRISIRGEEGHILRWTNQGLAEFAYDVGEAIVRPDQLRLVSEAEAEPVEAEPAITPEAVLPEIEEVAPEITPAEVVPEEIEAIREAASIGDIVTVTEDVLTVDEENISAGTIGSITGKTDSSANVMISLEDEVRIGIIPWQYISLAPVDPFTAGYSSLGAVEVPDITFEDPEQDAHRLFYNMSNPDLFSSEDLTEFHALINQHSEQAASVLDRLMENTHQQVSSIYEIEDEDERGEALEKIKSWHEDMFSLFAANSNLGEVFAHTKYPLQMALGLSHRLSDALQETPSRLGEDSLLPWYYDSMSQLAEAKPAMLAEPMRQVAKLMKLERLSVDERATALGQVFDKVSIAASASDAVNGVDMLIASANEADIAPNELIGMLMDREDSYPQANGMVRSDVLLFDWMYDWQSGDWNLRELMEDPSFDAVKDMLLGSTGRQIAYESLHELSKDELGGLFDFVFDRLAAKDVPRELMDFHKKWAKFGLNMLQSGFRTNDLIRMAHEKNRDIINPMKLWSTLAPDSDSMRDAKNLVETFSQYFDSQGNLREFVIAQNDDVLNSLQKLDGARTWDNDGGRGYIIRSSQVLQNDLDRMDYEPAVAAVVNPLVDTLQELRSEAERTWAVTKERFWEASGDHVVVTPEKIRDGLIQSSYAPLRRDEEGQIIKDEQGIPVREGLPETLKLRQLKEFMKDVFGFEKDDVIYKTLPSGANKKINVSEFLEGFKETKDPRLSRWLASVASEKDIITLDKIDDLLARIEAMKNPPLNKQNAGYEPFPHDIITIRGNPFNYNMTGGDMLEEFSLIEMVNSDTPEDILSAVKDSGSHINASIDPGDGSVGWVRWQPIRLTHLVDPDNIEDLSVMMLRECQSDVLQKLSQRSAKQELSEIEQSALDKLYDAFAMQLYRQSIKFAVENGVDEIWMFDTTTAKAKMSTSRGEGTKPENRIRSSAAYRGTQLVNMLFPYALEVEAQEESPEEDRQKLKGNLANTIGNYLSRYQKAVAESDRLDKPFSQYVEGLRDDKVTQILRNALANEETKEKLLEYFNEYNAEDLKRYFDAVSRGTFDAPTSWNIGYTSVAKKLGAKELEPTGIGLYTDTQGEYDHILLDEVYKLRIKDLVENPDLRKIWAKKNAQLEEERFWQQFEEWEGAQQMAPFQVGDRVYDRREADYGVVEGVEKANEDDWNFYLVYDQDHPPIPRRIPLKDDQGIRLEQAVFDSETLSEYVAKNLSWNVKGMKDNPAEFGYKTPDSILSKALWDTLNQARKEIRPDSDAFDEETFNNVMSMAEQKMGYPEGYLRNALASGWEDEDLTLEQLPVYKYEEWRASGEATDEQLAQSLYGYIDYWLKELEQNVGEIRDRKDEMFRALEDWLNMVAPEGITEQRLDQIKELVAGMGLDVRGSKWDYQYSEEVAPEAYEIPPEEMVSPEEEERPPTAEELRQLMGWLHAVKQARQVRVVRGNDLLASIRPRAVLKGISHKGIRIEFDSKAMQEKFGDRFWSLKHLEFVRG